MIKAIPKEERCSKPNVADDRGWHYSQCSRRGTITEEGKLWCFQHAPSAVRKRDAESDARYTAELDHHRAPFRELDRLRAVNAKLLSALEGVMKGLPNHELPSYRGHYCRGLSLCLNCRARAAIEEARK